MAFNKARSIKKKRSFCAATCESWWVIVESGSPSTCFLWNSNSREKIMLPDMFEDFQLLHKCILVSPPTESQCLVLFLYKIPGLMRFWRQGDDRWTVSEVFNNENNVILDVITCNKKIFAINHHGVINQITFGSETTDVTFYGRVPAQLMKKQQLVDSCGKLYLVQRKSTMMLEFLEKDLMTTRWYKISSLENRVFVLIGNYSASFSATELGIRGNCIYFAEDGNDETLYMFSLDDKSLSIIRNGPESGTLWFSHDRFMPQLRVVDNLRFNDQITAKEVKNIKKIMQKTEESEGISETDDSILSKIPTDVQKLIGESITTGWGYMNFRAVCRRWSSLVHPIRWKHNPMGVPLKYPWLMFPQKGAAYNFYDPMCKVTYHTEIYELEGCKILFSNNGWLLVSLQYHWSMFFLEPFTRKKIELPNLERYYCFDGISFSGSPTHSNWQIFGIIHESPRRICIIYLRSSDENWTRARINCEKPFIPSFNNIVYWRDRFYCLGHDGSLGIFELSDTNHSWRLHDKSSSLHLFHKTYRSFLVSSVHDLYSVFVSDMGNLVRVFKLYMPEMIWVELKSLKNEVLFFSQTSSLAVQTVDKTMMNTIQFSMFNSVNESNIFYSFKTGRYEIFNSDYSNEDLYDTKELLCSCWIQPVMVLDVK